MAFLNAAMIASTSLPSYHLETQTQVEYTKSHQQECIIVSQAYAKFPVHIESRAVHKILSNAVPKPRLEAVFDDRRPLFL